MRISKTEGTRLPAMGLGPRLVASLGLVILWTGVAWALKMQALKKQALQREQAL